MPKSKSNKVEFLVQVRFRLTQHIRDKKLFMLLIEYFNCGRIENYYKSGQAIDFVVTGVKNINSVIIPFFFKYKIRGVKASDYNYFCQVVNLINQRLHLTEDGLNQIRQIKFRMNSFR